MSATATEDRMQVLRDYRARLVAPVSATIPTTLKALDNWVCWKAEYSKQGNITKVLYIPREIGHEARSNDPSTWTNYDEAWLHYERRVGTGVPYQGVGIVLTKASGIVTLDFDKCRDPVTGEVASWASEILDDLRPYAEVSPSGKGIRGFVRSSMPETFFKKHKGLGFEVYDDKRFMTVTGCLLDGFPTEVPEVAPEVMKALHDRVFADELAERARQDEERLRLLEERQRRREEREKEAPTGSWVFHDDGLWSRDESQRHCEATVRRFLSSGSGGRHDALNKAAYFLGGMEAGGAPGVDLALLDLESAALASMGSERLREVRRTIADARHKGSLRPVFPPERRRPELGDVSVRHAGGDVALPETPEPARPSEVLRKIREHKTDAALYNSYRRALHSTLADPFLMDFENARGLKDRKSLKRMAECGYVGRLAKCKGCRKDGTPCTHKHKRWRRCKKMACPHCGFHQRRNLLGALRADLSRRDARRAQLGQCLQAWILEVPSGASFADMRGSFEKVRRKISKKIRKRVRAFTRVVWAPGWNVCLVTDELSAEALALAAGVEARRLSRLADAVDAVGHALDRRGKREQESLDAYVACFARHEVGLSRLGSAPEPIPAPLADELRGHEFRKWVGRSAISTAGDDADDDPSLEPDACTGRFAWPDAKAISEFIAAEIKRGKKEGDPELAHAWECPEHGTEHIEWRGLIEGGDPDGFALAKQPDRGRVPRWTEVEASTPARPSSG